MATKKKAAAKKTATKKATTKKSAVSAVEPKSLSSAGYSFDILADDNADIVDSTCASMASTFYARKNAPTGIKTAAEVRRGMIPYRHFGLQYLTGCYGIPEQAIVEIIGPEKLGKSTFVHWLMGGAMLAGIPCSIQETENKPLEPDWAARALHSDPAIAQKMLMRLQLQQTGSLPQMDQRLNDWCKIIRGGGNNMKTPVPLDTPILQAIDTWSKLLPKSEAAGFLDYGDNMSAENKKKAKATGEASNLGHAKFAHDFGRRWPTLSMQSNLSLIIVSHQKVKIDMNAKASSFMSAEASALYNKEKIGGSALNQNASLQILMARKGLIKNTAGYPVGTAGRMRVDTNSYGPNGRVIEFDLFNQHFSDTEECLAPSFSLDRGLAELFAEQSILGTTMAKKRFTSKTLGVTNVKADEFCAVFHANEELKQVVGEQLKIKGYSKVIERIQGEA